MKKTIFTKEKYTFKDYFDLPQPTEEILAELGYSYSLERLDLPKAEHWNQSALDALQEDFYKTLPKISLNSETAKREFLVAPLLRELAKAADVRISVEYLLDIDERLSGYLDYLIRSKQDLIVIELESQKFS